MSKASSRRAVRTSALDEKRRRCMESGCLSQAPAFARRGNPGAPPGGGVRRSGRGASRPPNIGPVLITLTLFVFAIAVIALAAMALRRSSRATEPKEARNLDPQRVEAEVYEKLYGKRSGTVSAPLPVEPPPKADPDSTSPHTTSADPPAGSSATPRVETASR